MESRILGNVAVGEVEHAINDLDRVIGLCTDNGDRIVVSEAAFDALPQIDLNAVRRIAIDVDECFLIDGGGGICAVGEEEVSLAQIVVIGECERACLDGRAGAVRCRIDTADGERIDAVGIDRIEHAAAPDRNRIESAVRVDLLIERVAFDRDASTCVDAVDGDAVGVEACGEDIVIVIEDVCTDACDVGIETADGDAVLEVVAVFECEVARVEGRRIVGNVEDCACADRCIERCVVAGAVLEDCRAACHREAACRRKLVIGELVFVLSNLLIDVDCLELAVETNDAEAERRVCICIVPSMGVAVSQRPVVFNFAEDEESGALLCGDLPDGSRCCFAGCAVCSIEQADRIDIVSDAAEIEVICTDAHIVGGSIVSIGEQFGAVLSYRGDLRNVRSQAGDVEAVCIEDRLGSVATVIDERSCRTRRRISLRDCELTVGRINRIAAVEVCVERIACGVERGRDAGSADRDACQAEIEEGVAKNYVADGCRYRKGIGEVRILFRFAERKRELHGIAGVIDQAGVRPDFASIGGLPSCRQVTLGGSVGVIGVNHVAVIDELHGLDDAVARRKEADRIALGADVIIEINAAGRSIGHDGCAADEQVAGRGIDLDRGIGRDSRYTVEDTAVEDQRVAVLNPHVGLAIVTDCFTVREQRIRCVVLGAAPNVRKIDLALGSKADHGRRGASVVRLESEGLGAVVAEVAESRICCVIVIGKFNGIGLGIDSDEVVFNVRNIAAGDHNVEERRGICACGMTEEALIVTDAVARADSAGLGLFCKGRNDRAVIEEVLRAAHESSITVEVLVEDRIDIDGTGRNRGRVGNGCTFDNHLAINNVVVGMVVIGRDERIVGREQTRDNSGIGRQARDHSGAAESVLVVRQVQNLTRSALRSGDDETCERIGIFAGSHGRRVGDRPYIGARLACSDACLEADLNVFCAGRRAAAAGKRTGETVSAVICNRLDFGTERCNVADTEFV